MSLQEGAVGSSDHSDDFVCDLEFAAAYTYSCYPY